ncbi:STAS domain-containing protein [Streptomyces sp. ISL-66]|uniref:STAS domain-containing protein n=1 Tax=Streptomyces sp. ISL-66 TaxID=2819186 RepID=UPI001BEA3E3D|nr:STAS domain-containing protein [Streptomyces sp. ISL-66]MBT2471523.1 STAS domain-containing protein [Streptomyces sp. ISL-66]
METDCFHIAIRRHGPTLHVRPSGEMDLDAKPAFTHVHDALNAKIAAVVCDMQHVPFVDVTGLNCLLILAAHARARHIVLFVYNWRPQPQHLLELLDTLDREATSARGTPPSAARALHAALHEPPAAPRACGTDRQPEQPAYPTGRGTAPHRGPALATHAAARY